MDELKRLRGMNASYKRQHEKMKKENAQLKEKLSLAKTEGAEVVWDGPHNEAKDDAVPYCGNCDEIIEEEWLFCAQCGTKILLHGRDIQ